MSDKEGESLKEKVSWEEIIQQDIDVIKAEQNDLKQSINELKLKDLEHDKEIFALRQTLNEIKEDTKWIRRMVTKAIVSAVVTGLIGGSLALFFTSVFQGG